MRKIALNLAISLDGYISDNKGGYPKIDLHLDKITVADGITILIYSRR